MQAKRRGLTAPVPPLGLRGTDLVKHRRDHQRLGRTQGFGGCTPAPPPEATKDDGGAADFEARARRILGDGAADFGARKGILSSQGLILGVKGELDKYNFLVGER